MNKDIRKNLIIVLVLIITLFITYLLTSYQDSIDYTKVEGETEQKQKYSLISYPEDSFVYGFNNEKNISLEVEEIVPIEHKLWDILWNEEDLYCEKSQINIVNEYYNDDVNYDWYFVLDTEDEEIKEKISLDESEISYMKEIDDTEINSAIFFEEMEEFGSLVKISKDKLIYGTTTLVKYKGSWYWKSDIISSDKISPETEEYATYVKPLPTELNDKILKLEKEIKDGIK